MNRETFLKTIGFPADLDAEAARIDAEAQKLWDEVKHLYYTKSGAERKKWPRGSSPEATKREDSMLLRDRANRLRRSATRLSRVHCDPWSHIRSEVLREYGLEAEALVVDAARRRCEHLEENARFIAEAEDVGGHWVYVDKVVPVGRGNLREGEHAVCVVVPDSRMPYDIGFMAWGFSPDRAEAERIAAAGARALREARFPS